MSRRPDHEPQEKDNQNQTLLKPELFKIAATQPSVVVKPNEKLHQKIMQGMKNDVEFSVAETLERLKGDAPNTLKKGLKEWESQDGLLLHCGRIYIPDAKGLRQEIVRLHHDHIATGHPGQSKTLELVSRNY